MTKPVRLIKEAEVEVWESVSFYENQVAGLGLDFESEIRNALRIIQQSPEIWPCRHHRVRRYLIERFPFAIHYTVEPDFLRVVAIAHCSRKPNFWRHR
jgi:toxin ParE1/3/4